MDMIIIKHLQNNPIMALDNQLCVGMPLNETYKNRISNLLVPDLRDVYDKFPDFFVSALLLIVHT